VELIARCDSAGEFTGKTSRATGTHQFNSFLFIRSSQSVFSISFSTKSQPCFPYNLKEAFRHLQQSPSWCCHPPPGSTNVSANSFEISISQNRSPEVCLLLAVVHGFNRESKVASTLATRNFCCPIFLPPIGLNADIKTLISGGRPLLVLVAVHHPFT